MDNRIKQILIEQGASDHLQTSKIIEKLHDLPAKKIDNNGEGEISADFSLDKETLRLINFKGEFLKPCPGTREYICCGYQILNVGANCPLDCSYCILQAYFNKPSLRIYVNLEDEIQKILKRIDNNPDENYRIGTGEFTDSLALDHIVKWTDTLLSHFSKRKNAVLELKTKTDKIDGLLSSPYRDRIIVSWSLNSPYIVSREEHGAPSLEKRLEAAKRCQSEGYVLGFHFDPLILHKNWEEGYLRTLEVLDRYIDPKGIIWISMGCIRYMPMLKKIINKRHPGTKILDGEFILGLDGKMRYFKPIRMEMYSFLNKKLKEWIQDTGLYLCMESDEVWKESLGWSPGVSKGLSEFLDNQVRKFFK
ncbi:radical SAM protein [Thermodesulfobacteriota bacterium]